MEHTGKLRLYTFTWDAPVDDGGLCIIDYQIRFITNVDLPFWLNLNSTDTQLHVILLEDVVRKAEVRALNAVGVGKVGSVEITPAPPPLMEIFTNQVVDNRPEQIQTRLYKLTWDAPADDGGDYQIRFITDVGTTDWLKLESTDTQVLALLPKDAVWEAEVKPRNAVDPEEVATVLITPMD